METNATVDHHEPWNKGKIVGQKAPFKLKDIWALSSSLADSEPGSRPWRLAQPARGCGPSETADVCPPNRPGTVNSRSRPHC